ncbi:alpha/beta fold hydrolase [Streptomyces sp. NPDC002250]|uniref:alpha/beta fold hydrolase n=1 Tax=Streptomyces sp. NPDC002250 TaxID=3364641 RepID=UPI0036894B12
MGVSGEPRRSVQAVRWGAAFLAISGTATVLAAVSAQAGGPSGESPNEKPTVVLVHGAFADASSWSGVVKQLQENGYKVIAPANPLRGVPQDSSYLASLLKSVKGPIVLAGHSYGGAVISQAAAGNDNVKALVYINAIMPDAGESFTTLSAKFAPPLLSQALRQVPFSNGAGSAGTDVYVQTAKFRQVFAADLPTNRTDVLAASQRPIAASAFTDKLTRAAWREKPVYVLVGKQDRAINPDLERFEARRAKARKTVEINASHVSLISQPAAVKNLIVNAAEDYEWNSRGRHQPA